MASKLLLTLSMLYLASIVNSNDIRIGYAQPNSRKIYSEIRQADPAIWRRTDDIIVNAAGNDVITAVLVTDLRDDKDGEAIVESGGVGSKSVTIGLKSPTILRGYKFEIEVYASDPSARLYSNVNIKGGNSAPYNDYGQYSRKY